MTKEGTTKIEGGNMTNELCPKEKDTENLTGTAYATWNGYNVGRKDMLLFIAERHGGLDKFIYEQELKGTCNTRPCIDCCEGIAKSIRELFGVKDKE